MKTKKLEIEYDEQRSLESTVDQLQSLVDGLRAGALTIARGDRRLLFLIKPEAPLEFTLHAERCGDRERLELGIEWRRQHPVLAGRETRPQDRAAASEVLDEGAIPRAFGGEQLGESDEHAAPEAGDDLDDEDFDVPAETLRQGNQLAQALQHPPESHPDRY